ncbi:hypothetical protein [Natronospora cellulosivora (SeqCode)]
MNREDGSVLVFTFLICTVLLVFLLSLNSSIFSEYRMVTYEKNSFQAQYYAESAIEYLYYLHFDEDTTDDPDFWDNDDELTQDEVTNFLTAIDDHPSDLDIEINDIKRVIDSNQVELIVSLTYNDINRKITATYQQGLSGLADGIFDNSMNAGSEINVHQNTTVDSSKEVTYGPVEVLEGAEEQDGINGDDQGIVIPKNSRRELSEHEQGQIDAMGELIQNIIAHGNMTYGSLVDENGNRLNSINNDVTIQIKENEILDLRKMAFNGVNINIEGNGIILLEDTNFNNNTTVNINYDGENFTDNHAILLSNSNFPNLQLNMQGMIYVNSNDFPEYEGREDKGDFNNNEGINLRGSITAKNNINTGPDGFDLEYDNGFLEVFNEALAQNNIDIPEALLHEDPDLRNTGDISLVDWDESRN